MYSKCTQGNVTWADVSDPSGEFYKDIQCPGNTDVSMFSLLTKGTKVQLRPWKDTYYVSRVDL